LNQVLLGNGDDTYKLTANSSGNNFFSADGGSGQDTLQLQGNFDSIGLYNATSFEILKIAHISSVLYPDSSPLIAGASGFSQILIDPGTNIAFSLSQNPSVTLSLNGGFLGILDGSWFAGISGSASAENVGISQHAAISGSIDLGGGDDQISLTDYNPDHPIVINGGDGNDKIIVSNINTRTIVDLSSVTNFESLVISGSGGASHIANGTNVSATGIVTIDSSIMPDSALSVFSNGVVTINANVQIGRFGAQNDYLHKQELAAIQASSGTSEDLTNYGQILGDVQLGMADDSYAGSGTVGGTVYGYAGNDLLSAATGDDRLDGGYGNDILNGGAGSDMLTGGAGLDTLTGGSGPDTFSDTAAGLSGDTITDFQAEDKILISDANITNFQSSLSGTTLTYTGGAVTLADAPRGQFTAHAVNSGGVELDFVPSTTTVHSDFNGNGCSDILWRNDNGLIGDWLSTSTGSFTDNSATFLSAVPTSWHVADTGDFNGDGRSDILWRNDNGLVGDWLGTVNGGFTDNSGASLNAVPTSWHVVGTGDFNADGRDDILWRNDNGLVGDWLGTANGGFVDNSGASLNAVSTDWKVAGTGDFNGDGRADILWRNDNGLLVDWLGTANGGFVDNSGASLNTVPMTWHVVGTGDFNGDGRDDILWRNDNGLLVNWLAVANGGFADNSGASLNGVPTNWHVAGTGDFNGDGRADIMWRNDNGLATDWLGTASGGFVGNDANFLTSVSTDWKIQNGNPIAII